jgi:hypothetical protein
LVEKMMAGCSEDWLGDLDMRDPASSRAAAEVVGAAS